MKRPSSRGFTLVEIVVAAGIFLIVAGMILNGSRFLQTTLAHQMRLDRMSQVLNITQEISREVRSARRILAVSPTRLEMEVYNHAAYQPMDPLLYENTQRLLYEFRDDEPGPRFVREIFISTAAVTPLRSTVFLSKVELIAPTEEEPFFSACYLVGQSTTGVRIALALHPPYSGERWLPATNEVYVKAQ